MSRSPLCFHMRSAWAYAKCPMHRRFVAARKRIAKHLLRGMDLVGYQLADSTSGVRKITLLPRTPLIQPLYLFPQSYSIFILWISCENHQLGYRSAIHANTEPSRSQKIQCIYPAGGSSPAFGHLNILPDNARSICEAINGP